ncbi:PilZ domain-containing protein [uncultured Desulfosarcina sp.]|uniref:PilZ domain-containing protein n=1 Tax=uncultured Desulfosarcina sp. TaxID=218289 RepID=UPI0029C6C4DD|nr:PilZ domain-containing protein [uncultured Desulfosarcina sp.]
MATTATKPAAEKENRVFINDKGQGTFICPACEKGVIRDLSQFSDVETAVRLKCKCSCGNVYRVLVERRRHFRKPVNLVGMFLYRSAQKGLTKGLIKVQDISQSGLRFSVNAAPEFEVGSKLTLEFTLDDEDRSQVQEDCIVRRIRSNLIGVEFDNLDHYGKLGRYLFR